MLPVHFRDTCLSELIETETNYVEALNRIINKFAKTLEPLLRREDHQLLFGHIKYFHRIHSNFQAELTKAAFTTTVTQSMTLFTPTYKVSLCFLAMKEKFLKYRDYCAALPKSQALLKDLVSKSEAIAAHLDCCQQEEGYKLKDLLSLPIQRILKYHLLLAQLIKNSQDDDRGLRDAYDVMVDLGHYLNEVKRDTEALVIINDIQQSISGSHTPLRLTDYGRLIVDGFIRIGSPKQKKYVFVFDKILLICEVNGFRQHHLINTLDLADHNIETLAQIENRECFQLVHLVNGTSHYFFTKTLDDKNKWMDAIQKAINTVRPVGSQNHDLMMHTFEQASSCDTCGKLLHGLYYQGYKCSLCSVSVHGKCIATLEACKGFKHNQNQILDTCSSAPLEKFPWFYGQMSRERAQNLLEGCTSGTFLVRISPHNGGFVISLNTSNGLIKHIKIHATKDNYLYLSQNRYFRSVQELVSWYERNSLAESFHMLDAFLTTPIEISSSSQL